MSDKVEVSSNWASSAHTVLLVVVSFTNAFTIDEDFVSAASPNTSLEACVISITAFTVAGTANAIDDVSVLGADASLGFEVVDFVQSAGWSADLKGSLVNLIGAALAADMLDQVKSFTANAYSLSE